MLYFSPLIMILISFLTILLTFLSNRKHLLNSLITLEFMVTLIFLLVAWQILPWESLTLFYFIIFTVCESVLGLSLLVVLVRSTGTEFYANLSLLLW